MRFEANEWTHHSKLACLQCTDNLVKYLQCLVVIRKQSKRNWFCWVMVLLQKRCLAASASANVKCARHLFLQQQEARKTLTLLDTELSGVRISWGVSRDVLCTAWLLWKSFLRFASCGKEQSLNREPLVDGVVFAELRDYRIWKELLDIISKAGVSNDEDCSIVVDRGVEYWIGLNEKGDGEVVSEPWRL